jgi:hypothetical protein
VVAHGGTIDVERGGQGTAVAVTIPVDPSPLDADADDSDFIDADIRASDE